MEEVGKIFLKKMSETYHMSLRGRGTSESAMQGLEIPLVISN
jgi:hypothetical protein